jgi:predicted transcriptional regulator
LDELVLKLLAILDGEMGRSELMEKLHLKHRQNFIENYLNPSIQKGWVQMTLPDKPKSNKQKYSLTELGFQVLKGLKNK